MLAYCKQLSDQVIQLNEELNLRKSCMGKLLMYNMIFKSANKAPSVSLLIEKYEKKVAPLKDEPLAVITINGKTYNMVLKKIRDCIAGEYIMMNDITKMTQLTPEFEELLEEFDRTIIENAVSVFKSLKVHISKSNPEFAMIKRSNVKLFTYYYPKYKQDAFGLLFIEV